MRPVEDSDLPEFLDLCERYEKACGKKLWFFFGNVPRSFVEAGVGDYEYGPIPNWEPIKKLIEKAIKRGSPITDEEAEEVTEEASNYEEGVLY